MIPDFNLCDVCGAKVSKACRIHVVTEHGNDSNGEYSPSERVLDLCPKHQADVIKLLLEEPGRRAVPNVEAGKRLSIFIDQLKRATNK